MSANCPETPFHPGVGLVAFENKKIKYVENPWLKANTVKRRTHSLFRQGFTLYEHIPNWPEDRLHPLLERFEAMLREQRVFRDAFGII